MSGRQGSLRSLLVEEGAEVIDILLSLGEGRDLALDAAAPLEDAAVVAAAEEGADLVERLLAFVAK